MTNNQPGSQRRAYENKLFELCKREELTVEDEDTLLEILERAPQISTAGDEDGWTALIWASSAGHANAIEALIKAGAEVDAADKRGNSAITWAAYNGKEGAIQALLRARATVNKQNKWKRTPIYYAAEQGHLNCVKILLRADAQVDIADTEGKTPLHVAATPVIRAIIVGERDVAPSEGGIFCMINCL